MHADARFAAAFGARGRPGISPGQLTMASVLQFSENLADRQPPGRSGTFRCRKLVSPGRILR